MTNYTLIYAKRVGKNTQYFLKQGLLKDDNEKEFLVFLSTHLNQEALIEEIMKLDSSLLYLGKKVQLSLIEQLSQSDIYYKKWFTKDTVIYNDKKELEHYLDSLYHYGQDFLLFENQQWKRANTELLQKRNKFNMNYFFSFEEYEAFKKNKRIITQEEKIRLYQKYIYPEKNKKKSEYLHYLWDFKIEKIKGQTRPYDVANYQLIQTLVEKLTLEESLNKENRVTQKKVKI